MEPRPRRRRTASRPSGPPSSAPDIPGSATAALGPPQSAGDAAPGNSAPESVGSPRPRRRQRPARTNPADLDRPAPAPERRIRSSQGADGLSGGRGRGDLDSDRALRALVSIRSTQLPVDIALRAREAATPTAADLAEADRDVVLVRRHYVPPTPLNPVKHGAEESGGSRPGPVRGPSGPS